MKLSRAETNTIAGVVTDLLFIAGAMHMHDAARKRIIEHAETLTALVGGADLEPARDAIVLSDGDGTTVLGYK